MAFTLEHVQQVRNGQPRQVGVLPDVVWKKLAWPCPWVYLGQSGLQHIAAGHPDVTDFDLLWLPLAIASGAIVSVRKNPRQIIVSYEAEELRFYRCALKSAQNGTEIWVDSFYRIKPAQVAAIMRKGDLLRHHL